MDRITSHHSCGVRRPDAHRRTNGMTFVIKTGRPTSDQRRLSRSRSQRSAKSLSATLRILMKLDQANWFGSVDGNGARLSTDRATSRSAR